MMDYIKVTIPSTEILNNDNIRQLALASLMLGASVNKTEKGVTEYTKIKNEDTTYNLLTLDVIALILSLGGEIKNYQTYIEVNPEDLVPLEIRGSTDSEEDRVTWANWVHPNNTFILHEGKNYISSYSRYAGFKSSEKPEKCLLGSELNSLRIGGYIVLNKSQFQNLINNE